MDATHFHLVFTHLPVIGILFGIAFLAVGIITKNSVQTKIALITFVLIALLAIPVFLTGEGAEETVEQLAGVSENVIEEHEELAEIAIWVIELLGVFSLLGLITTYKKVSLSKVVNIITLITALSAFGIIAKVSNLGGQIRHTEIRRDFDKSVNNSDSQDHDNGDGH